MPQRKPFPRDEVAAKLRKLITSGDFAPGAQLPTQREIAREYGCAERTALEALRILASDGLIVIRPRQGSLVAIPQQTVSGPLEQLDRVRSGGPVFRPNETVQMLRVDMVVQDVPVDALAAFGLPEDSPLGLREYLIRAGERPVTYGASYIHPEVWKLVPELRSPEPIPDGIIGAIARVLGRHTAAVPPQRHADGATAEEAAWLGVDEDSPVLVETIQSVEAGGAVVEWNISVHPRGYRVGQ